MDLVVTLFENTFGPVDDHKTLCSNTLSNLQLLKVNFVIVLFFSVAIIREEPDVRYVMKEVLINTAL